MQPSKTKDIIMSSIDPVISDPRVQDWPLMASPVPLLAIFVMYLITIRQGPKLMASQKALELSSLICVYNVGLVLLSAYMFYEVSGVK